MTITIVNLNSNTLEGVGLLYPYKFRSIDIMSPHSLCACFSSIVYVCTHEYVYSLPRDFEINCGAELHKNSSTVRSMMVPTTLTIKKDDVLFGRGKVSYNHPGNKQFRMLVKKYSTDYNEAMIPRSQRTDIVSVVIAAVHQKGGRFLRMDDGEWLPVKYKQIKEKVSHALRDVLLKTVERTRQGLHPAKNRQTGLPTLGGASSPSTTRSSRLGDESCEKWEQVNSFETLSLKKPDEMTQLPFLHKSIKTKRQVLPLDTVLHNEWRSFAYHPLSFASLLENETDLGRKMEIVNTLLTPNTEGPAVATESSSTITDELLPCSVLDHFNDLPLSQIRSLENSEINSQIFLSDTYFKNIKSKRQARPCDCPTGWQNFTTHLPSCGSLRGDETMEKLEQFINWTPTIEKGVETQYTKEGWLSYSVSDHFNNNALSRVQSETEPEASMASLLQRLSSKKFESFQGYDDKKPSGIFEPFTNDWLEEML